MEDYERLYKMEGLRTVWEEFFGCKVLYRALMLSRTVDKFKMVYIHAMDVFERAFRSRKFDSLKSLL